MAKERLDPEIVLFNSKATNFNYPVERLATFLSSPPQYGANEAGILRLDNSEPRYIRITDIDEHGSLVPGLGVTAINVEEKYFLENNDLLFARSGNTVGKSYLHKSSDKSHAHFFAGYMIRFTIDAEKISPDYVFAFTQTRAYADWVKAVQRVTGQPNINADEYKSLPIPFPPSNIQNAVIDLLETAYEVKTKKEQEAERLLESIDSVVLGALGINLPTEEEGRLEGQTFSFYSDFGQLGTSRFDANYHLPRYKQLLESLENGSYPVSTVREKTLSLAGGATPHVSNKGFYEVGGIKFLRIMNVAKNRLNFEDTKYISEDVHSGELYRSQLAENDVLVTITGRVGTAAVVTKDALPANINQHIVRLRFDEDINPFFFAMFLNTSFGTKLSNRSVSGGTRIALDYGALRDIRFPVPSLEVQNEIVGEVQNTQLEAERVRAESQIVVEEAKQQVERMILGDVA